MANFRFELNYAGVGELLKSGEVQAMLNEYAGAALGRLPAGYAKQSGQTGQRAKATVYTEDFSAMLDNSRNNSLLKAVMGGNG